MKRNRQRVTYRPGKASGVVGLVAGGLFVILGIFVLIPAFGAFGIIWTLFAVIIMASSGYQAFGKNYMGPEISIESDDNPGQSAEERLQKLRDLYEKRLITQEEYDEKREKILNEL